MNVYVGVDLGSTTTKAVLLDRNGNVLGRGITNSRSNYAVAARLAGSEAAIHARFELLRRQLGAERFTSLERTFRLEQTLAQLGTLREACRREASQGRAAALGGALPDRLDRILDDMVAAELARYATSEPPGSNFFRDQAGADFTRFSTLYADKQGITFEILLSVYDRSIPRVENSEVDLTFEGTVARAQARIRDNALDHAVQAALTEPLVTAGSVGTGYGRARLPFPKEQIRSEILCHGLGAHSMFPGTRTVLDIGGQDTKAIQVDEHGIVTNFQMNDRCAAGCGRYLGYIADEMNLGLHELGPLAQTATRPVRVNSTCTVFAGAELRDRLSMGERREDILAGLHRAIILRAMSLLARSGGVTNEFTFTGGVARNVAAVRALRDLVAENYGERTVNISPDSIYTGALGAAIFAFREGREQTVDSAKPLEWIA